jgi:hypothetical protein
MNITRLLRIVSTAIVIIAVLAGLYLSGSPGEQRLLRLDERRVSDLLQLSYTISTYWDESARLPAGLSDLVDGQRLSSVPEDPQSGTVYSYETVDTDSYRLCAEFARGSSQPITGDFWEHPAGPHCFELSTTP